MFPSGRQFSGLAFLVAMMSGETAVRVACRLVESELSVH